jgi:hypothetical protein
MGTVNGYIPEPSQLTIFGTISSIVKRTTAKIVFNTAPMQYMLPLKDCANSPRQPLPIRCKLDLATPRYTKTDGKPWAPDIKLNGRALIYGSIARIARQPEDSPHPKQMICIKLSINKVVYSVGGQTLAPKIEPGKANLAFHLPQTNKLHIIQDRLWEARENNLLQVHP